MFRHIGVFDELQSIRVDNPLRKGLPIQVSQADITGWGVTGCLDTHFDKIGCNNNIAKARLFIFGVAAVRALQSNANGSRISAQAAFFGIVSSNPLLARVTSRSGGSDDNENEQNKFRYFEDIGLFLIGGRDRDIWYLV